VAARTSIECAREGDGGASSEGAIELGMCRRIGGTVGSITGGKGRFLELRGGTWS